MKPLNFTKETRNESQGTHIAPWSDQTYETAVESRGFYTAGVNAFWFSPTWLPTETVPVNVAGVTLISCNC